MCVCAAVVVRLHRSSSRDKGLKCLQLLTEAFVRRSCSDNKGGVAEKEVKGVWAAGRRAGGAGGIYNLHTGALISTQTCRLNMKRVEV